MDSVLEQPGPGILGVKRTWQMSDFKPVLIIPLLLTSTTTSRRIALINTRKSTTKLLQMFAEREVEIEYYKYNKYYKTKISILSTRVNKQKQANFLQKPLE